MYLPHRRRRPGERAVYPAAMDDMTSNETSTGGEAVPTDLASMSRAIHEVYCGVTPDHDGPNDKDKAQAQALLDAIRRDMMTL
jgi:hypothetical protein